MAYIDGYVTPVGRANRAAFIAAARHFDELLIAAGALRVVECWAADVEHGKVTDSYRAVAAQVEAQIKAGALEGHPMPFDGKRTVFGGFEPAINIAAA